MKARPPSRVYRTARPFETSLTSSRSEKSGLLKATTRSRYANHDRGANAMKVLVVSEGQHELGRENREDRLGALTTLVSRTAVKELICTAMRVSDPSFSHSHGAGGRLFERAYRCMLYAAEHEFDALVFLVDQDDDPSRRQHLDKAQDDVRIAIGRAFGLAVRTFDAWIIADEQALTSVLQRNVQREPNPEDIGNPEETLSPTSWRCRHEFIRALRRGSPDSVDPKDRGAVSERLCTLCRSIATPLRNPKTHHRGCALAHPVVSDTGRLPVPLVPMPPRLK